MHPEIPNEEVSFLDYYCNSTLQNNFDREYGGGWGGYTPGSVPVRSRDDSILPEDFLRQIHRKFVIMLRETEQAVPMVDATRKCTPNRGRALAISHQMALPPAQATFRELGCQSRIKNHS